MALEKQMKNGSPQADSANAKGNVHYKRLWQLSVSLMLLMAIIPLSIFIAVNYLYDLNRYKSDCEARVEEILIIAHSGLNFVINERLSALSLVLSNQPYEKLVSDAGLQEVFMNLRMSFGGFLDLGLIDSEGRQRTYAGHFDLQGKDYKDQAWFDEVIMRGEYVSDVFKGYRKFPHFIIAIKQEKSDGSFYILRATIDLDLLDKQILSANFDRNSDAFIVNQNGILQTHSQKHGDLLEDSGISVPRKIGDRGLIETVKEEGKLVTKGFIYIEKTPFILVAVSEHQNFFQYWMEERKAIKWYVLASLIFIIAGSVYLTYRMVSTIEDIDTRRAKALHNIEYTNKMATIGRMAASVAHEINNPLAIINEKAGLLKDMVTFNPDHPQREKTLKVIESIHHSVERCSLVTHRLLGFGKRMDVRKELIDLEKLMLEVVGFIGNEAEHRNININYNFPPGLPPIESDRGQLQQVFVNIVNNAIAAVEDGGRIDLEGAMVKDKVVTVAITDNGKGIKPENLKHIFEPFFSTKGEFGTGLGLSITRDIISKLGGQIYVESEVGEGTRFLITFPLNNLTYLE